MKQNAVQLRVIQSLSEISEVDWNALLAPDAGPFLKYAFLNTLEKTGCVGGKTGWQVAHLILKDSQKLLGAMPLYLKQHSYGEFVFDWSWAQAYEQQGLQYFPKALCAIPFTPVQGARILCAPQENSDAIARKIIEQRKASL